MINKKGSLKTCRRGHEFYKSSNCPTCPICWNKFDKQKSQSDFPEKVGSPALRALNDKKIKNLKDLTKYTKKEIANLHGIGPNALNKLEKALKSKKLSFKN